MTGRLAILIALGAFAVYAGSFRAIQTIDTTTNVLVAYSLVRQGDAYLDEFEGGRERLSYWSFIVGGRQVSPYPPGAAIVGVPFAARGRRGRGAASGGCGHDRRTPRGGFRGRRIGRLRVPGRCAARGSQARSGGGGPLRVRHGDLACECRGALAARSGPAVARSGDAISAAFAWRAAQAPRSASRRSRG